MERADETFNIPSGNWMARRLRLINDESKTLFPPKTANSRKSYNKYETVYRKEFKDSPDYCPKDCQQIFEAKRETVQDILFAGNLESDQMFMRWNIPDRILNSTTPDRSFSAVPSLREPERISRQSTLPEILHSNHINNRPASQISIKPRRTPSRALGTPASSSRLFREQNTSPDLWAVQSERRRNTKKSVANVLRTHDDQKYQMLNKVRKTLDPEGRILVDKWLDDATDEDRKMALKLFSTLDNYNLPDTEKQLRIEGILNLIKRNDRSYNIPQLNTNLKYIRLQEPENRAKRWMHTTWHHLPQYRDIDPVTNPSSMYTKPHEPIPHNFVIHPDWG